MSNRARFKTFEQLALVLLISSCCICAASGQNQTESINSSDLVSSLESNASNLFKHPSLSTTSIGNIIYTSVLTIVFGSIILSTLIGNSLVILAVVIVRRLHTADNANNLLIVSLAVSDLLVGIFAMPFAVYVEMSNENKWYLGAILCDLWTLSDVLLCTASILNLCAISVDRYFIILQPMVYTQRRNAKLMLLMILVVWLLSALISIPPLFGWGKPSAQLQMDKICMVSSDLKYQIYATMFAFYLPCLVMVVIYLNIYRAAKKVKQREMETAGRIRIDAPSITVMPESHEELNSSCRTNNTFELIGLKRPSSSEQSSNVSRARRPFKYIINTRENLLKRFRRAGPSNSAGREVRSPSEDDSVYSRAAGRSSISSHDVAVYNNRDSQQTMASHVIVNVGVDSRRSSGVGKKVGRRLTQAFTHLKRNSSSSHGKNQKATRTLGVIMGCFILCWLPFFILAVVKPISLSGDRKVGDYIPKFLDSLLLWLGYFNSALNPMIYARFNREFRQPFVEILCFRCRGLNDKLRNEERRRMYPEYVSNSYQARISVSSTAKRHARPHECGPLIEKRSEEGCVVNDEQTAIEISEQKKRIEAQKKEFFRASLTPPAAAAEANDDEQQEPSGELETTIVPQIDDNAEQPDERATTNSTNGVNDSSYSISNYATPHQLSPGSQDSNDTLQKRLFSSADRLNAGDLSAEAKTSLGEKTLPSQSQYSFRTAPTTPPSSENKHSAWDDSKHQEMAPSDPTNQKRRKLTNASSVDQALLNNTSAAVKSSQSLGNYQQKAFAYNTKSKKANRGLKTRVNHTSPGSEPRDAAWSKSDSKLVCQHDNECETADLS
nr:G protein-coupled receptor [Proales similis]